MRVLIVGRWWNQMLEVEKSERPQSAGVESAAGLLMNLNAAQLSGTDPATACQNQWVGNGMKVALRWTLRWR